MLRHSLLSTMLSYLVLPLRAPWVAATPAAETAAQSPRIAAALEATARFEKAIMTKDVALFESLLNDDLVANNPYNQIARKQDAVNLLRTGLIDYTSFDRSIEYAAVRGAHEVILMGEEVVNPVGKAKFADKKVRRRITEIWTDATGSWQLAVRQATYCADD